MLHSIKIHILALDGSRVITCLALAQFLAKIKRDHCSESVCITGPVVSFFLFIDACQIIPGRLVPVGTWQACELSLFHLKHLRIRIIIMLKQTLDDLVWQGQIISESCL